MKQQEGMKDSRGEYLNEPGWEHLHTVGQRWQSDMKFFADEVRFFYLLTDRLFGGLVMEERKERAAGLARDLETLDQERHGLNDRVDRHLNEIENIIQNPFPNDAQAAKNTHEALEVDVAAFVRNFKEVKRELFLMAEEIMESDKARRLLNKA